MAHAMISTVVGAIISNVTERVVNWFGNKVNLVRGMEEEILDLSDKLKTITIWLDDAEKRGWKEPSVKNWLKKLEDTAHEMDDILDEWNYFLVKHEKEYDQSTSTSVATSDATAMKIQNVKVKLDQILKEKNDFKFAIWKNDNGSSRAIKRRKMTLSQSSRVQSTSSIKFEKVYGEDINKNKKDIVRRLMVNGESQILCIVGMGGLGKTTLAQLVYNTQVMMDWFDLRIWICVSDPFDVGGIARAIVQSVTGEIIPPTTNQLEIVLRKLRDCISGKKFLLVLDDVWTEKYGEWGLLEINLKDGAAGSKILVTTRKERVAKMMGTLDDDICRPKPLSIEECWSLLRFLSLPGRSEEECREFKNVGKKIARKCDGLPLAASVLGSLLQFKDSLEEWEKVVESEIWQLEEEEDVEIFPHLVLSYNELSPTLKRCFSYLAIYPKDSIFTDVNVIDEWIAIYLGSVVGNGQVELKGREYFKNLAMRSLLQEVNKRGEISLCKMHDIVHDFAQFLKKNNTGEMKKRSCQVCGPRNLVSEAQEYRSLVLVNEIYFELCDCFTSLRVFRFIRGKIAPSQGMGKLIHLRLLDLRDTKLSKECLIIICRLYLLQTLLLEGCSLKEIPKEIKNLDGLRKLDLSRNALIKLPESICNLLELKTLSLAYCGLEEIGEEIGNIVGLRELDLSFNGELKELPESICDLLELQILNLQYCNLNRLPERIHMLQNLQQLLIEETPVWNCMPKGVGQLSGLRKLTDGYFRIIQVGSDRNKLGLLKNLNRLTGDLTLGINFSSMSDLEELVEEAREAQLRNKIHLQSFCIHFMGEVKEWSSSSTSLCTNVIEALVPNQKLQDLKILGYSGCRFPHWISSPLNLVKRITLYDFSEVTSLPHMGKLPLLEYLSIDELSELKVVGREFLRIESSSTQDVVAFPKLKKLKFIYCKKWEEWEDITVEEESAAVSIMPCLTHLTIESCSLLKKLPHRLLLKASSLQILKIRDSQELEKSYRDKDGSAWRSISQCNPQLQLTLSS